MHSRTSMDALSDSIVAHILQALQPRDLSRCMCVNRQWRGLIPTLHLWTSVARTRWKYWDDKWQPLQAAGQWKQIHDQRLQARCIVGCARAAHLLIAQPLDAHAAALRVQADAQAEALLARTVWPLERHQCLAELRAMGQDALACS